MEYLISILENILKENDSKCIDKLINEFQKIVWNVDKFDDDSIRYGILKVLAHDLDYYVPDAKLRAEDSSYYGEERMRKEIEETLEKLAN